MTKVEHTKTYKINPYIGKKAEENGYKSQVLVTDAKLVLIDLPFEQAQGYILCQCIKEMNDVKVGQIQLQHKLFTSLDYWRPVQQILISENNEKIEVGDWCYQKDTDALIKLNLPDKGEIGAMTLQRNWYKILALPEHFSPQQLKDIVDGKLKDNVLVECETRRVGETDFDAGMIDGFQIKLNPYITIYPVEEKPEWVKNAIPSYEWKTRKDYSKNVYDQLSDLHDWICTKMESISQEEINKDSFQLGRFRTYQSVIDRIKSYPIKEKMYTRKEVKEIARDAWVQSNFSSISNLDEWFEQNVK